MMKASFNKASKNTIASFINLEWKKQMCTLPEQFQRSSPGKVLLDYGEFATCHSGYSLIIISNSKGSAASGWFTVPAG